MKINVTLILVIILVKIFFTSACNTSNDIEDQLISYKQRMDSIAGARIDSAYKTIQKDCDLRKQHQLPLIIDSLLKNDSSAHE